LAEYIPDPRSSVFFMSYVRSKPRGRQGSADNVLDARVQRFFRDLRINVEQLVPLPPGQDHGFMDTTMEGGELWRSELLKQVGQLCQVFVALISSPYLDCKWCAREWDLFSRRPISPTSDQITPNTAILPVLWAPIHRAPSVSYGDSVPRCIAAIQLFEPAGSTSLRREYLANGLFGLLQTKKWSAYHEIVWKLSLQVQRMHASQWVEPIDIPDVSTLRRNFGEI
jgi:hypothetical protein